MPDIAVRPIDIMFLEFFADHIALHIERTFAEIKMQHAVAFQPERCLYVIDRQYIVVVGEVVRGESIVGASG